MWCVRFGYSDKNLCRENLSSIPTQGGETAKAKAPVTVYLCGRVDVPDRSVYSSCISGNRLQANPNYNLNTQINPLKGCLAEASLKSGVFVLAEYLQTISKA